MEQFQLITEEEMQAIDGGLSIPELIGLAEPVFNFVHGFMDGLRGN